MLQPLSISENTRPYDSCPRRALPSATTTNGGDALGHLSNAAWRHSVVRAETMSGPGPWARACPGRSPLSALVHRSHRRLLPSIRTSPQRPLGHTTPQSRLTCAPNAPSHVRCLERELPLDPLVILLHPSVSAQCGRVSTQALVYHPKSSLVNCDVDSDRSLQIRLASVFEQWSITRRNSRFALPRPGASLRPTNGTLTCAVLHVQTSSSEQSQLDAGDRYAPAGHAPHACIRSSSSSTRKAYGSESIAPAGTLATAQMTELAIPSPCILHRNGPPTERPLLCPCHALRLASPRPADPHFGRAFSEVEHAADPGSFFLSIASGSPP
ncbi:hypothetical protein OH76DRAFT_513343 [Lentinus brumalis]|uniref:Uncharacterized protein n=1 Tax=Lentinus brumalis TaxID=2498619 RepID=A0A371DB79_9APHY|nr:hypothetical protein OH76DRAFT_513343 [Polyporus brumalis]